MRMSDGAETEDAEPALFSPRAAPGETAGITSACSFAPPVATPGLVARADVLAALSLGAARGEGAGAARPAEAEVGAAFAAEVADAGLAAERAPASGPPVFAALSTADDSVSSHAA